MWQTEDAEQKTKLAHNQGQAYDAALAYMKDDDVAARAEIDDYIVTVACEKAEGMYLPSTESDLQWQKPTPEQNLHVEVAVQDKADKRFLPGLDVRVQLYDASGNAIGESQQVDFLWHPFLYHYGKDWSVPGDGTYTVSVYIAQPKFPRHDSQIGDRYKRDVTVDIGPLTVKTGQKPVGPE